MKSAILRGIDNPMKGMDIPYLFCVTCGEKREGKETFTVIPFATFCEGEIVKIMAMVCVRCGNIWREKMKEDKYLTETKKYWERNCGSTETK